MERAFIFDNINTFNDWRLILNARSIAPPKAKTKYVQIDGMNGTLDLSESLTGEVTYDDRTVSATFLATEGDYNERVVLFDNIIEKLHGKKVKIIEPDNVDHYFIGRINVKSADNNRAYGKITIEATCEPWRYSINEFVRTVALTSSDTDIVINNNGVKTIYPEFTITGEATITIDGVAKAFTPGTYKYTALKLRQGSNVIKVKGDGSIIFKYREASL